ncbi:alpha/beta fold hydrolase [Ningiella sp. W23]|uniref:alpha/beta fold hydrolase n=1 Tax=Ningiella sp. W23 TaxID=3023715 RepID=UPI00375844BF
MYRSQLDTPKQSPKDSALNIVLLHGWGTNSGIFKDFLMQLNTMLARGFSSRDTLSFSVQAIDLPGYGDAFNSSSACSSLSQIAVDTAQRLPKRCLLIGWSLGGLVAQQIAIHGSNTPAHKKACDSDLLGVVTMCSSPKFLQETSSGSDTLWPGIKPDVLEAFNQQLTQDHEKLLKRFIALQSMGQSNAKVHIQQMLQAIKDRPIANSDTLAFGLQLLKKSDLRAELWQVTCPLLHLYGRLDSLVPHQAIPLIDECSKHSNSITYPKASHAPFVSHPQAVLDDIFNFINTLDV